MQEWRSALQSRLMRNIVTLVIALDAAGVFMIHYRMTQPVNDVLIADEAQIVTGNANDDLLSDSRVWPEPEVDGVIVKVAPAPVPDFAFYSQAEVNSQAPVAEEIERNADAAAREYTAASSALKVANSRPRTKIGSAKKGAPAVKLQRAMMTFSKAFPEPDVTSAAAPANAIDQFIVSDDSRSLGITQSSIVEGYEHTPDAIDGFESHPDAAPESQTDEPSSGTELPGMSELPPLEPAAEPSPLTQLPA